MSLFRSAITEHGEVDPGYLGLYVVMVLVLGTIPTVLLAMIIRMIVVKDHPFDLFGLAAAIASCGTAFGAAAAGVGLFRAGDKPRAETTTTIVKSAVVTNATE